MKKNFDKMWYMIISLVGMKHVGKSTLLAKLKKDGSCIDLDDEIEGAYQKKNKIHKSTREIYSILGAKAFRAYESTILEDICKQLQLDPVPLVFLATGGGIAEYEPSMCILQKHTRIIHLLSDVETIWKRIIENGIPAYVSSQTKEEFLEIMKTRTKIYSAYTSHTINANLPVTSQRREVLSLARKEKESN